MGVQSHFDSIAVQTVTLLAMHVCYSTGTCKILISPGWVCVKAVLRTAVFCQKFQMLDL